MSALYGQRVKTPLTAHLKIYPVARTLAERREVLRVTERFGEVTMFKSFKHIEGNPVPNAFLVMFSSEKAVDAMISASPIRYRLLSEPIPAKGLTAEQLAAGEEPAALPAVEKVFELSAGRSSYSHETFLTSYYNPLRAGFQPMPSKRMVFAAHMNRMLPRTLWSAGLADWESHGVHRLRMVGGGKDEVDIPMRMVEKVRDARRRSEVWVQAGGLKKLWEDGKRRREAKEK